MKLIITLKDIIYWVAIGILCWLAFKDTAPDNSLEVDRLKFERDSIISAMIDVHQAEAKSWRKQADSSHAYIVNYERADSINKYKSRNERRKIPHYTPAQRSRAVDSILTANNIR